MYCGTKILSSDNESSLVHEEDNITNTDDRYEDEEDTPPKVDKAAFRKAHDIIPDSTKLRLSTGKVVEDVLF